MTREEHLLSCLAEECAEVVQRVSKALRFGLRETQVGADYDNSERICLELEDLISVAYILREERSIPDFQPSARRVEAKRMKIEQHMEISREQGVLQETTP